MEENQVIRRLNWIYYIQMVIALIVLTAGQNVFVRPGGAVYHHL